MGGQETSVTHTSTHTVHLSLTTHALIHSVKKRRGKEGRETNNKKVEKRRKVQRIEKSEVELKRNDRMGGKEERKEQKWGNEEEIKGENNMKR